MAQPNAAVVQMPTPLISSLVGCPCLIIPTVDEAKDLVKHKLSNSEGGFSLAVNAEKMIRCTDDPSFRRLAWSSSLPVPDGAAAVIAARLILDLPCTKIDLPRVALECANDLGVRAVLIGAEEAVNSLAVKCVIAKFPKINPISGIDGYRSDVEYIEFISIHSPQLVLLGLGSPKQELMASELAIKFPRILFVCCGGAIDALAGNVPRAPQFFVDNHLEWAYRLLRQPRRWRRQLAIPRVLFHIVKGRLLR